MKLTLRERVLIFFARNPEEELTTTDIVQKWGADRVTVGRALRYAVDQGLLNRAWKVHTVAVYSAGPVLLAEVGR